MTARSLKITDENLARQAQKGFEEAFSLLFYRYEQKIFRNAVKTLRCATDAQDIVQEVFIKAYRNIDGFDCDRRFSPWIYRIAHNELMNAIKKRQRDPLPFFDADTLFPHPVAPDRTERSTEEKELKSMLESVLMLLPKKYRDPLILYYFKDLGYREIADKLGIPIGTVGVRLRRAKHQLRHTLKKNDVSLNQSYALK